MSLESTIVAQEEKSDAALPPAETDTRRRRRSRPLLLGAAALLAAILVVLFLKRGSSARAAQEKKAAPRAVPVVTASARVGDMDVYLQGLGSVTPVATVTLRSRVDGQLVQVAFHEGQLVREGELLARIDPRPFEVQLHQAEGQKGKDEANLENARIDLARYQTLLAQDSIPKQQLDTQVATVHQLEATLESDQAQIEGAQLNLTYSRITSPIAGRVGLRLVDPGNIVHAADPNGIVVVTRLEPIALLFTIPADQLPPLMKQTSAGRRLVIETWDRERRNLLATGALDAVDNQIDPTTGTVRLKGLFPNQDHALFANQFVNARLALDTLRGGVIVPTAALQQSPREVYVWVVKPDSSVEKRSVEVRHTEGEESMLGRGVSAGEAVVTEGVDNLQPGTKVAARAP